MTNQGKKVWVVCISDCESTSILCVCSTKEIAIKKMFEARDNLVKEWKESFKRYEKDGRGFGDMYKEMINALSSDNYEQWDNYPHEVPYFLEKEIVEEI